MIADERLPRIIPINHNQMMRKAEDLRSLETRTANHSRFQVLAASVLLGTMSTFPPLSGSGAGLIP